MQRIALVLIFIVSGQLSNLGLAGATVNEGLAGHTYTNAELGFSYIPPAGLHVLAADIKGDELERGKNAGIQFNFLLRMSSQPDENAQNWAAIGITTYPRGREKDNSDDLTAGFFTNHALVPGTQTEMAAIKIAGRDFSMTRTEWKNPTLIRFGVTYTTVRQEKFLSFFFIGNDRAQVLKLSESMNTLKFRP